MKKTLILLGTAFLLLAALSACMPGPNPQTNGAGTGDEPAGFWLGLWHGIITPVTFIISLFSDNIHFYEVVNNGNWYNLGYIIGIIIIFGGSGGGAGRGARRK